MTGPAGALVAEADPAPFAAVTTARRVEFWSALDVVYVDEVAPEIDEQLFPDPSQRVHWYAKLIGVEPDHEPVEAVTAWPTCV